MNGPVDFASKINDSNYIKGCFSVTISLGQFSVTSMSKVICILLWFYIKLLSFRSKTSRYFLGQSEVKPKPITTGSQMFSSALCVSASNFDGFNELSVFSV